MFEQLMTSYGSNYIYEKLISTSGIAAKIVNLTVMQISIKCIVEWCPLKHKLVFKNHFSIPPFSYQNNHGNYLILLYCIQCINASINFDENRNLRYLD